MKYSFHHLSVSSLPFLALFLIFPLLFITGCAGPTTVIRDTSALQWPPQPEQARVKYVRWWTGEDDFKKSFFEGLAGEEMVSELISPRSVTTDAQGNIYVADISIASIPVFDVVAQKFRLIDTRRATIPLRRPVDVMVDEKGNMWVADPSRQKVIIFNKEGRYLLAIGGGDELANPIRLVEDRQRGRVYVVDSTFNCVRAYDLQGKFLFTIGRSDKQPGDAQGSFFRPQGIDLDRHGNIYVADTFNFRIQSFTPEGNFRFAFGGMGDSKGNFARPVAVAVDSDENIYVTDVIFSNIQAFDKDGKYIFTIGENGGEPGQFILPTGIHIDQNDMIYVVDQGNRRIQVFQYLSKSWKIRQQAPGAPAPKQ